MNKFQIAALLSVSAITSSAMASTHTLGDVFNGISKVVSKTTAPSGNATEETVSAPSGMLVKDLPDLPKLADKPYIRGLAKLDYGDILFTGNTRDKNSGLLGHETSDAEWLLRFQIAEAGNNKINLKFQQDAIKGKVFDRINTLSVFSNPYANQSEAFDLSKLDDVTRNNTHTLYAYTLNSHIKVPDEFVNKNGKIVFESEIGSIRKYRKVDRSNHPIISQVCYQTLNGALLLDKKATYSVKKGNIIDYSLSCYFNGAPDAVQTMKMSNELLPKSWTVYSVPDPLAKDAGQSYTVTNRDMFLYENEVYPAK
jgi:hypothetical protein